MEDLVVMLVVAGLLLLNLLLLLLLLCCCCSVCPLYRHGALSLGTGSVDRVAWSPHAAPD